MQTKPSHLISNLILFLTLLSISGCILLPNRAEIRIDATRTGEPISKYIYGQFIEHLGRCIQGGVWAEMLEDRKFFFPIADEFNAWSRETEEDGTLPNDEFPILVGSPWRVIGGKDIVKMLTEKPYAGEHTPEIRLEGDGRPRGITHGRLGLIRGKAYTGRIILAGDNSAIPIKVSLVWGKGANDRDTVVIDKLSDEFVKVPLKFKAGADTQDASLEIAGYGRGAFQVGAVSLMPADNVKGFRKDTMELMKQLEAPVYRWPGGCFVGGYDWRDGLGVPDKRPPRKNPAWSGIEQNDMGIHEFIELCELLETEPFIAVDSGIGSAEFAAQEVEYCNGDATTAMGRWRAANGHPEPFKVKWWAVGNEMFGKWQNGYMPLPQYVKKHNATAKAMLTADPSITLIAVGKVGKWDEKMLADCADYMHLISEHFYLYSRRPVPEYVALGPARIRAIAGAHRNYRKTIDSLKGKGIQIAMDEWNYDTRPHYYGELGSRYTLKEGLGIAACLHEFFRNTDIIFMANYAQTVNVLGCIKTNRTDAVFATTGLPLTLYRHQFGEIPVEVSGEYRPLDIAAAWTADRRALTIGVVNPTGEKVALELDVKGAALSGKGRLWLITGPDAGAYNVPGEKPVVTILEKRVRGAGDKLYAEPLSITLYRLPVR